MAQTEEHLKRWLEAGLIKPETAETIRIFERDQRRAEAGERPGALEALLYLGFVVLAVGVFSLFAQNWEDLESWARVIAIGVPTLLLFGVGLALHLTGEPQLERGGQAAWMVTVALFAGTLAVAINEYGLGLGDPGDPGALLPIAAATFAVSIALWVASPAYPQLFAIAGATLFVGIAVANWPDEFSQELLGMTILSIALAALALAEVGWLTPVLGARFLFSALAIFGPFAASMDDGPVAFEVLAGAMAAAVIAYGVFRASFALVLVGVVGAFAVLIAFITRHFSDRIGAPMAMIISGGILIAGILLLALYRRELQNRKSA